MVCRALARACAESTDDGQVLSGVLQLGETVARVRDLQHVVQMGGDGAGGLGKPLHLKQLPAE
jgi:hypothetical protein